MNTVIYYASVFMLLVNASILAAEKNLLQDGFAALAVSTDSIEAIYVQALEDDLHHSYAQLGANWDSDNSIDAMLAGMQVIEEPKILFVNDDSFNNTLEIAFENSHAGNQVKLTPSDVSEINETLIFSQIKARSIDPQTFNVNLDDL